MQVKIGMTEAEITLRILAGDWELYYDLIARHERLVLSERIVFAQSGGCVP